VTDPLDRPWQDIRGLLAAPASTPASEKTDATERPPLTRAQKWLVGVVSGFVTIIAGIGFAGSYSAVTKLAAAKGFGWFAWAFPAGVDSGIGGFLALDLLLTWLRIPYPLLRQVAWFLTAATICFNASASWGDPVAVGMHATIPLLFITAVEGARHAVGRIADITADRHMESPPLIRWFIAPWPTFRIWRRMRMWQLLSYNDVITLERETRIHRRKLRLRHGRQWRSHAAEHDLLALTLARYGTPVHETLATHAEEVAAERESQRAESVQRELDESNALALESARETPGESDSHTRTAKPRESSGKKKPQRARRESGRESRAPKVSSIADIERETAALVALMEKRGSADEVSLPDAERITGKSQATAARRLSSARDHYRRKSA
jgi:hypothetical protein